MFVAAAKGVPESNYTGDFVTVVMNWKTGKIYREFPVPSDTHDVDYLGNDTYAVADKQWNSVYVYDYANRSVVWRYNFTAHFPPYPKAGGSDTGYTHVNDIDSIENGSAFLVSPRNFDRVMAINRSTKKVEWTLGEENNYTILDEQHNPELLSEDPITVLVADSENDRVIEYEKHGKTWKRTWEYDGKLQWPRDADRLPNGNTLIVDSRGNRVIEVTPRGKITWQVDISYGPYDAERLSLGDEPTGPTAREMGVTGRYAVGNDTAHTGSIPKRIVGHAAADYEFVYETTQWVLPTWLGRVEFGLLALVPFVGVAWAGVEVARVWPDRLTDRLRRPSLVKRRIGVAVATVCVLCGVAVVVASVLPSGFTIVSVGMGVLAMVEGARTLAESDLSRGSPRLQSVGRFVHAALRLGGILTAVGLLYFAATGAGVLAGIYVVNAVLVLLSLVRPWFR